MVDLFEEALRLQLFLEDNHCLFCIIGGIAVQWWGEPRLTRDVDVSLLAGFGGEDRYIDLLLSAYSERIPDARGFAQRSRVLLLQGASGAGIDVSLAALPYEQVSIERSILAEMMPGCRLRICSAEDLIIMKLFAGRDTDYRDAKSVAIRQRARLNWDLIESGLANLAELTDDSNLLTRARLLREASRF